MKKTGKNGNKEILIRAESIEQKKQIFLDAKKADRSVSKYLIWLWKQFGKGR